MPPRRGVAAAKQRDRSAPEAQHVRGAPDYRSDAAIERLPVPGRAVGWDRERLWSSHVDWEPVVAADPRSDWVYQMASRYYAPPCEGCPDPIMVFRRSPDGGVSWEDDRYPFTDGDWQNDPQLAVATDGTVFAAWLQDWRPGVRLSRSTDNGVTWSKPVHFTGERQPRWSDHPLLLISDDGQDVYVAFNNGDSWVAASHDGGLTFGPPVRTNDDARYWFQTGGVVTASGDVLIAAADYSQDYRGEAHLNVLRSTDGGGSWVSARVDTSAEAPACDWADGCYFGYLGPRADLAVDAAGTVMLVYNAGARGDRSQRLWYRTSTDALLWSRRRSLPRPSPRVSFVFPAVVAGPDRGDFRVAWMDDRRAPQSRWNTWSVRTVDAGATWESRVRLSGGGPETSYSDLEGYAFPYGDYFQLAVDGDGRNHVVWGAGESYDGSGGVWYTRGR
ncbi:MAG TPA: sialidase family protein [Acidobacteriota bacterium]|nr:sialidase family protein [Acidobacteriota bacterium]